MSEFEIYLAKCRAESMRGKPLTKQELEGVLVMVGLWITLVLMAVFLPK